MISSPQPVASSRNVAGVGADVIRVSALPGHVAWGSKVVQDPPCRSVPQQRP